MRKETIIAIVMGILLGVGIGFVVLFQSRKGDEAKVIPVSGDTENTKIVKTSTPQGQAILEISEPKNKVVVNTNKITIKGAADKNSLIVIQSPITNTVFKTEKIDFTSSVPLALGENTISISAYSDSSTPQEMTLQVYYIKE
jgi:hypothetical protein